MKKPKVFISYSWTDEFHQERVKQWADRLMADGIEVILDVYDLKEGNDKYVFMESMVTDPSVTHVLVICDKGYAEKADARKAGVGTESQIISGEVYKKVKQSKFIPIVCAFEDGEPILPAFMESRIWINFSSLEKANESWEQLVRVLYGKPQHAKPEIGPIPSYITNDAPLPTSEAQAKFNSLKQAILQDKKGINRYRRDFIESCIKYADALRVRERPKIASMEEIGKKVLEDCRKLKAIRDHLCDWILLEGEIADSEVFSESVIDVLEKLVELKSPHPEIDEVNPLVNPLWFEAHAVFVYETFLYIVAACLKTRGFSILHDIYSSRYFLPSTYVGRSDLKGFNCFWGSSRALQSVLAPEVQTVLAPEVLKKLSKFSGVSRALQSVLASEGIRLYAPAAELIKRQADREDLPFMDILQADLLTLLMSFITPNTKWYPQTLHRYSEYESMFPFFVRAAQHKHFNKLSKITGIESADELRAKVREGYERFNSRLDIDLLQSMNIDKLDTLR